MSTSDQQGNRPLTRKQLREIRLTGSTPVITEEEAAAAAAPPAPPLPRAAEPVEIPPAPVDRPAPDGEQLTRRQVRERERLRTASVSIVGEEAAAGSDAEHPDAEQAPEQPSSENIQAEERADEQAADEQAPAADAASVPVVTEIPRFTPTPATSSERAADETPDETPDEVVDVVPVSAAAASSGDVAIESAEPERSDDVADLGLAPEQDDEADASEGERPTVNPAFGKGVLDERVSTPPAPSFDELLTTGESAGSAHIAPNALIFTPSPGEGSLSGPVASTGEVLITGSYELPQGLGSQGHAHGTADGKDVDAVLIDGELPPASSPTPIAASAAVSTSKSAGEVIRPPAPDKGNKLMLALAITAGGLALAVAVTLVIAFTGNVLN